MNTTIALPDRLADLLDRLSEVFKAEVGGTAFTREEALTRILLEAGFRYLAPDNSPVSTTNSDIPEILSDILEVSHE